MRKLVLSLAVLASCSPAPVETHVARATPTLAPTGPHDPQMDQPEAASPQIALEATTTSVTPSRLPESRPTEIAQPRPAQKEVSSPTTTILLNPPDGETLRACIAHYESTSGLDPNIYQFTDRTWQAYGGTGQPEDASYAEQTRIFWLAWNDAGRQHWAAQKGRCF